jgi:hypothetical protein
MQHLHSVLDVTKIRLIQLTADFLTLLISLVESASLNKFENYIH